MKPKLVVLDANFYWTEQLFSACHDFADVLLLRPVDFRAFKQRYGHYSTDWKPQPISSGVWEQRICCPPGWLFHYWLLTQRFLIHHIRQFQGGNPLVFIFNFPYYTSLAKALRSPSVYYSIDDYRDYWAKRETQTVQVELQAIAQADLTLCVAHHRAQHLQQVCPSQTNRIIHIPHGCSPDFMVEQPLVQTQSLPSELNSYPRPIAGYIGTLNYRFDFYYLAQVAECTPEVTFLLGGKAPEPNEGSTQWWKEVERVRKLPNVHFIGTVEHNRLGEYLQSFDVLLMLYSDCNFNLNACPTKLWDYMGTSRPIVANNVVPEVNRWSDVLLIAQDPTDYSEKIRFALNNPTWNSKSRLEIAKANTWEQQAEKLYQILESNGWLSPQIL
ncbi:MAG: glycosyltransferase [Timaviella obliquedivisa GSE-PSE-MK23-08B]|jgi:hypothetical protein|nr:glycosyltransferase [Timaviella obliquedivisa GSE-PSE-MK23-08B]